MLVSPLMAFRTTWQSVVGTQKRKPCFTQGSDMLWAEGNQRHNTEQKHCLLPLPVPTDCALHMTGWEKLQGTEMTHLYSSPFVLCCLLPPLLWCPPGIPCANIIALGRSTKHFEHVCCLYYVTLNKEHFNIKLLLNSHTVTNVKLQKLLTLKVEKV